MKRFTLEHDIHCGIEHFWKVFFDEQFNKSLFLEELGFPAYEILEQTERDGAVRRRIRGTPKMNVPRPIAKLLGDSFSYQEEGHFDASTGTWHWEIHPSTLRGKLSSSGTVRIEQLGEGKCRRIAALQCEAKVFGVGGLLESTTEKQMRDGWNASAAYMNKWLAEHPPG